ncbi:MAG TPA: hypothetical protein VGK73_14015, partial [Polyangiaceae bacterium]
MDGAKVIWTVLLLALAGCGGRSERDLAPAPEQAAEPEPTPDPDARDSAALAAKRCAKFGVPEFELEVLAPDAGYPVFGACGHLTMLTTRTVEIWGPGLDEVLATSIGTPRFSPEGTRVVFRPTREVVRRLDLLTGRIFDTPLAPQPMGADDLDFGLFTTLAGEVQSWVCDARTLRVFADRAPQQAPVFEGSVPSCVPQWTNDGVLLWLEEHVVTAVDLRARRRVEHVLPAVPQPDILANALDGYATAQLLLNDEHVAEGPLLSTRDGAPLAERWELVAMADGRNAANRLDSGVALLVDDGDAIVSIPGLRGQYVFRDQRRAFAFREGSGGRAELVFVDLRSGEATGIGEYPSEALDLAEPFGLTFGVSPHERAAYFVLGPDEGAALDAPRRVVRWLDGQVELLEDRVLTPATRPGVADDGTAVFSDTRGSVRFRPGAETLSTPG